MIVGFILLLVGVMWLLESLGIVAPDWADTFWPVLLIAFGAWIVYNRARFGRCSWRHVWR